MPTINQLPLINEVTGGDNLVLWVPDQGDSRRCPVSTLAEYIQENFESIDISNDGMEPGLYVHSTATVDNGSGIVPRVPADGLIDIQNGELKIWPDLDGDGDYDADIWARSNFYLATSSRIHLRTQIPESGGAGNDEGRLVIGATNTTNYIQSAKNFSGTVRKDFAIGDYNSSAWWMYFKQTSGGFVGVGNSDPLARFHITETGANDVFRVDDSTSPDATPFLINQTGRVINGYTTAISTTNYGGSLVDTPRYQQHGLSQSDTTSAVFNWGTSTGSPANLILNKSVSGSVGSRGAVTDAGTDIGSVTFNADNGTNFLPAAAILVETNAIPSGSDMPGRMMFMTTPSGGAIPATRMDIDKDGNVAVGTAAIPTTATDGFLYIPSCAGIPTGIPTTKTGLSPMVVDNVNNKLYVYIGGAWQAMN